VADTVRDAPRLAKEGTQGNPLAAGFIAFGAGLLLGSILPRTRAERQAEPAVLRERIVEPVKDKASETAREMGQEVRQSLQPAGEEAVQSVRSTASEAAHQVKQRAQESAERVKDEAGPSDDEIAEETETGGGRRTGVA
jgi:gas vesicle protein